MKFVYNDIGLTCDSPKIGYYYSIDLEGSPLQPTSLFIKVSLNSFLSIPSECLAKSKNYAGYSFNQVLAIILVTTFNERNKVRLGEFIERKKKLC